jgi:hypothetical protein
MRSAWLASSRRSARSARCARPRDRRDQRIRRCRVLRVSPTASPRPFLVLEARRDLVRGVSESLAGVRYVEMSGFDVTSGLTSGVDSGREGASRARSWHGPARNMRGGRTSSPRISSATCPSSSASRPTLRRFWTMVAHYHGQTWAQRVRARLGSVPRPALPRHPHGVVRRAAARSVVRELGSDR